MRWWDRSLCSQTRLTAVKQFLTWHWWYLQFRLSKRLSLSRRQHNSLFQNYSHPDDWLHDPHRRLVGALTRNTRVGLDFCCCFFLSFFRSFAPILKLISGCDTPEIHYWATWALANLCNVDRKLKALCHSTDCVNNCALNFCVTIFLLSKYSLVKVN